MTRMLFDQRSTWLGLELGLNNNNHDKLVQQSNTVWGRKWGESQTEGEVEWRVGSRANIICGCLRVEFEICQTSTYDCLFFFMFPPTYAHVHTRAHAHKRRRAHNCCIPDTQQGISSNTGCQHSIVGVVFGGGGFVVVVVGSFWGFFFFYQGFKFQNLPISQNEMATTQQEFSGNIAWQLAKKYIIKTKQNKKRKLKFVLLKGVGEREGFGSRALSKLY